MPYSRWFAIALLSLLTATLGWTAGVMSLGSAPGEAAWWLHEVFERKIAYAARTPGRRVLIVAGSNGIYGLSAAELTRQTGVPAVNMALHAGLGLRVIFAQALRVARRGDLVVMPIEYELYQDDFGRTAEAVGYRLAYEPLAFVGTEGLGAWQAILGMPVDQVARRARQRLLALHAPGPAPAPEGFNPEGDFVRNLPEARDAAAVERLRAVAPSPALLNEGHMGAASRARITEFVGACRERGVTVVATYPNAMAFPAYRQPTSLKLLATMAAFYDGLGVALVGPAGGFFYPRAHFFDTVYHLLHDAQLTHTRMLARHLAPHLRGMRAPGP